MTDDPRESGWRSRLPVLAEGTALSALAQVVRTVAALISVPLTIGYLGREAYGLWMVTLSLLTFLSIVDAGLSPPAKNRMAQSFALHDIETFRFYSSGVLIPGGLLALVGAVVVPVVACFDWGAILAISDPTARAQARVLVVSAAALGFANISLAGVEAIYAARLKIGVVAATSMAASIAGLGLLVAATSARAPLWTLPAASVGPIVIARTLLIRQLWIQDRRLLTAALRHIPALVKELLPSSAAFIAIQGAYAAILAAPNVLLARYSGVGSVAQFSIAMQIVSAPLTFVAAVLPAYWPTFTIAWTRHELGPLRDGLRRNIMLTAAVLSTYGLALLPLGKPLALIWTRGAVIVPTSTFVALGIWLVSLGIAHWLATLLNAINDLRFQVFFMAVHAAVLALVASLLVPIRGDAGAAASMGFAVLITWTLPLSLRVRWLLSGARTSSSRCAERP